MKSHHLRRFAAATALAIYAALGLTIAAPAEAADRPGLTVANAARGKYLVATSGCMDCHTPMKMGTNGPEWDMSRMLSGHPDTLKMPPAPALPEGPWLIVSSATNTAFAGPWGVSFTANLTPDAETGLGKWTVNDFKATIRTGRHMGRGREILPPMPIPVYSQMNDRDLESIFAYLRTIPAVKNRVPEPWAPAKK
ncbi:MAG TPA: c-type cytochrome [Ramlibacter sp.]|nr:c-type cytochrome [Ramlibacter sp.]